jgi:site-specific recombinase XerC
MSDHLPLVDRFLSYLIDERHFSPYTSRCYGLDLRQYIEFMSSEFGIDHDPSAEQAAPRHRAGSCTPRRAGSWPPIPRRSERSSSA